MRIPSGVTDQYIYFVAVDSTDFTSRETGLSSFTVYRSRNGGAAAAMTTPTINETDATNMPGVYELLLDEDMTIDSGDDSQEMAFHITHAGMAPVTRTIELYRPKITAGETLTVSSGSASVTVTEDSKIASGTAQAATASTLQLASGETFADDEIIGSVVVITGGSTGVGQSRVVSDYVSSTDTATVSPDWTTTPTGTITYSVYASPPSPTASAALPAVNTVTWNGVSLSTTNPLPNAAAGGNGGLPTVNASNYVAGVQGTLNTLDALDSAQDTQHSTTQSAIATAQNDLDTITGSDGVTLATTQGNYAPATAAALATVDGNVDIMVLGIITGTAQTGTLSTTQATTDLTGYADDQIIGRILTWTGGACEGEQTDITDYASASGLITFTALTTAPSNTDPFKIT